MTDVQETSDRKVVGEVADQGPGAGGIFPEFEELHREIAQRIRDNSRFLERIFDEDFADDEENGEIGEEEFFEEL